jgi:hypothetical protein
MKDDEKKMKRKTSLRASIGTKRELSLGFIVEVI